MIYTTLNHVRRWSPDPSGWRALLKHLGKKKGDREPVSFAAILSSYGLDDTLLLTRAAPKYAREWRLFAVWCARQVQHLTTDPRSIAAIDVAERYAYGNATAEDLQAASAGSLEAVWDAPSGSAQAVARECANATTMADAGLSTFYAAVFERDAVAKCAARPVEKNTFMQAAIDEQTAEFLRLVKESGE